MPKFIETIKLKEGVFFALDFHQKRLEQTCQAFNLSTYHLSEILKESSFPRKGLIKTRFLYDENNFQLQFLPYQIKPVKSLKLVESQSIEYNYKFEDRSYLHSLYEQRGDMDDILIVKNGLITDTYYANVVLSDGTDLFTPKSPLLKGVKRAQLIDEGRLVERDITLQDLSQFESIQIINALIDLEDAIFIDLIK